MSGPDKKKKTTKPNTPKTNTKKPTPNQNKERTETAQGM